MRILIFLLLVSLSCEGQISRSFFIGRGQGVYVEPEPEPGEFTAKSGQGTFPTSSVPSTVIPDENLIPELFLEYSVPAKGNLALMVFMNAWGSGGQSGLVGSPQMDFLHNHNIAFVSVGKRGRNTGAPPGYANDASTNGDVEKYRDASGIEPHDIYTTIKYFLDSIVQPGQIDTTKIFGYGSSGGGGNSLSMGAKFPEQFSMIVDWFGMGKYGSYAGDPDGSFLGWGVSDTGFQGAVALAVGGIGVGMSGYTAGLADALYLSRDHIRFYDMFLGKTHFYHYTGDGFVDVEQSDKLRDRLISTGQTYSYHRSTSALLYDHGNFDLYAPAYDTITPYGLHWLTEATTLTRQYIPRSGTMSFGGYRHFGNAWFWIKRYRKNGAALSTGRTSQGRLYACNMDYNLDTDVYTFRPIFPPAPTEQQFFMNVINNGKNNTFQLVAGDTITTSLKLLNKQPLSLSHNCTLYYNLTDTDGYILDQSSRISNIVDLSGHNHFAFQNTRASRKTISSGSIATPIYMLKGTAAPLSDAVDSYTLSGPFTMVVKVSNNTVSFTKPILGRGTSSIYVDARFGGKTQMSITIAGTNIGIGTGHSNTEVGTGVMVLGFRRDASNNVYIYSKSAAGFFSYGNRATNTGIFDLGSIGGTEAVNTHDGSFYKLAVYGEDIGDTDITSVMNDFYNN